MLHVKYEDIHLTWLSVTTVQGQLSDGAVIAVKKMSSKSSQGNREFITEIGMISGLQHPNLVKLYGCCIERDELLLVYEYMENNCLGRALFGKLQFSSSRDYHALFIYFLCKSKRVNHIRESQRILN